MEQSIGELRNELVDYTDITPNEPRYTKEKILDATVFYPLGNMYPRPFNKSIDKLPFLHSNDNKEFKKEYFCNQLYSQQIKYAILYLQVSALKKFIIKNQTNVLMQNPFYYLFETNYPICENSSATKEIIKILIDCYDDHSNMISSMAEYIKPEQKYILELIYTFLQDDNIICSICFQTEPKKLLICTCQCKTPTHASCLVELNTHKKLDKCSECNCNYKLNKPIYRQFGLNSNEIYDETIFFPFNDIYYQPLSRNKNLIQVSGMSRLTFAILYLQVERVKELLNENEILNELPNYYFGYEEYKQTPLIALAQGNMQSNAHVCFGNNKEKYIMIMNMLLDTNKIDLSAKDGFDKSFQDYITDNKYFVNYF
jgi:hypothetical protein